MTDKIDTIAETFMADLCANAQAMTDDELLASINAYDPLDQEFAHRFRTLTAERDGLWAANLRLIRERDAALARADAAEAARDDALEACCDLIQRVADGYAAGGDGAIACALYSTSGAIRAMKGGDA